MKNCKPDSARHPKEKAPSSIIFFFVELRGFEPLTPCMPCRCSAELSYSPMNPYFTRRTRALNP